MHNWFKNYPAINAEIQGDEIVYKNYYNISIAVGTDKGLVVPVIRNSDELSFADIEKNIGMLGQKARDGKITIEDLQGGTLPSPTEVFMDLCVNSNFKSSTVSSPWNA